VIALPRSAAACGLALLIDPPAAAQSTFWVPAAGGNWFTAANWSPATVPNDVQAWAQFGRTGTGSQTVTVDGSPIVGRLTFGLTNLTSDFSHTLSGGGITLNNFTPASIIERVNTTGAATVSTPLTISTLGANALTVRNIGFTNAVASGALTLASLAGTNSTVTVNPSGTNTPGLVVFQSGTYGGVTEVEGGILRAADGAGLPATTSLRLTGSTANFATTAYWELPSAATVTRALGNGAGQLRLLGSVGFSGNNGPVTVNFGGGAQVVWGSAAFDPTRIVFGHRFYNPVAAEQYTWQNPIDLSGANRAVAVPGGNIALLRATATLTGVVSNSAGTPAGLSLSSSVDGVLELTAANTYNGPTTVGGGVIFRAIDGVGLPSQSNLVVSGGTVESAGATALSRPLGAGAGQVRLPAGTAGFAAVGSPYAVQIGGATLTTLVWGTADFNPGTLRLGSVNSDALTDFRNPIDLNVDATNAVRFVEVRNNVNSATDVGRFSGVISNSGATGPATALSVGGVTAGVVELAGANTYNVQTVVTSPLAGVGLRLVGTGSFADSPVVTVDTGEVLDVAALTGGANYSAGFGRFLLAPGQTLAGTGTVTGGVVIGTGAVVRGGSPPAVFNQPTGQLTLAGGVRLLGTVTGPPAALAVDLNGAAASGALVSRVAVTGAGNTFDLTPAVGPGAIPVAVRLLNDQNLVAGQAYSFTVASSAGGFTKDGVTVSGYLEGLDFTLASATFPGFSGVSLAVAGSNLVLGFTPVPEPAAVLAAAVAGLGLARRRTGRAKS
jgi:autotransporter-associated beta strand protein